MPGLHLALAWVDSDSAMVEPLGREGLVWHAAQDGRASLIYAISTLLAISSPFSMALTSSP